jgi:hypothetical protein
VSAKAVVAGVGEGSGAGAIASSLATLVAAPGRPSLLLRIGGRPRAPALLATADARELERRLAAEGIPGRPAARGRFCELATPGEAEGLRVAVAATACIPPGSGCVIHAPGPLFRAAVEDPGLAASAAVLRADLPGQRPLVALAVRDLIERGLTVRVLPRAPAWPALAAAATGLPLGGRDGRRLGRIGKRLAGEAGQALPLVIGAVAVLLIVVVALASVAGALSGKGRAQRAADLAALSAARSMRDDLPRLLAPAELPSGLVNPRHLDKRAFLQRARRAGKAAAAANGIDPRRLAIEFPDRGSFAPLRARAAVTAALRGTDVEVEANATAEAMPAGGGSVGAPANATGGGYSGPLAWRQGEGMRPDVAAAFDRMAKAAAGDGVVLVVTSGFRSDAEQAELFAANPDPRWVAPPGQSLHRCGTELDLSPPSAYAWLAANAPRFGFLKRYSWEPWHFGYTAGPPPCSSAGNAIAGPGDDRGVGGLGLPAYVPAPYRAPLLRSAARWDVSAAVLAAQLMAESNFNPLAVSPAGAQGIAQFMPATAAAYGLSDPFDAAQAIDAQAHLMSDLLGQFGSVPLALAAYNAGPAPVAACGCVPGIPETTAYVARIMGLLEGAGVLFSPPLAVRLIE